MCWHIPVIPVPGMRKWGNILFKVTFSYVGLGQPEAHENLLQKQTEKFSFNNKTIHLMDLDGDVFVESDHFSAYSRNNSTHNLCHFPVNLEAVEVK